VTLQRKIMEDNGDAAKPIWFDEFGWNASPADMPPDKLIWGRVTEQQQADYTRDAIQLARSQWPWVGVINIWYFRQVGSIPQNDSSYYFDMVDPEFNEEAVYAAVRDAAGRDRGHHGAAGRARRRLGMADLRLYRSQSAPCPRSARFLITLRERRRFHGVADARAGAVRLDHLDGVGIDAGDAIGGAQGRNLTGRLRSIDCVAFAVARRADAAHHGVNLVAVAASVTLPVVATTTESRSPTARVATSS